MKCSDKPTSTNERSLTSAGLSMPKSKTNFRVAPIGLEQAVDCSYNFKVPSQLYENMGEKDVDFESTLHDDTMVDDDDSNDDVFGGIGGSGNLYLDYLPFFNTVTKLCKGLGPQGEEILCSGLRTIRQKALEAHAHRDTRKLNDLPHVIAQQGKAKRKSKPSSPKKSQGR
jgi:hypothetical protein